MAGKFSFGFDTDDIEAGLDGEDAIKSQKNGSKESMTDESVIQRPQKYDLKDLVSLNFYTATSNCRLFVYYTFCQFYIPKERSKERRWR